MSLSVADIAAEAYDGVAAELTGVIKTVILTRRSSNPDYDPETGVVTPNESKVSGRIVFGSSEPAKNPFPDLVLGAGDSIAFLEGMLTAVSPSPLATMPPKEADTVTVGSKSWSILRARDVVEAAGLWPIAVRPI